MAVQRTIESKERGGHESNEYKVRLNHIKGINNNRHQDISQSAHTYTKSEAI